MYRNKQKQWCAKYASQIPMFGFGCYIKTMVRMRVLLVDRRITKMGMQATSGWGRMQGLADLERVPELPGHNQSRLL